MKKRPTNENAKRQGQGTQPTEVGRFDGPSIIPRVNPTGRKIDVDGGFGDGYFTEPNSFDPGASGD